MAKCRDCEGSGLGMYVVTNYDCTALVWEESDCVHCDGTGEVRTAPYRLADGTWSDGVDRSKRIVHQTSHECHQNRVFVWRYYDRIKMKDLWVAERQDPWFDKEFDSFAEAIAYADAQARTTTNGETK